MKFRPITVLRIVLSTGNIGVEKVNAINTAGRLGGRGLAVELLYREGKAAADPFPGENTIVFAVGAFTGMESDPTATYFSRFTMATEPSNRSGAIVSNAGGFFGRQLRAAGFDALVLIGKSPKPVCLSIQDDRVLLVDAAPYTGKCVSETVNLLRQHLGDSEASVVAVGPAGERGLTSAVLVGDGLHAFGRSGGGEIFGRKNLKAIAVSGTKIIEPAQLDRFQKTIERLQNNHGVEGDHSTTAPEACGRCSFRCERPCRYQAAESGSLDEKIYRIYRDRCGIDDQAAVRQIAHVCNEYGMDAMAVARTISEAMAVAEPKITLPEEHLSSVLSFGSSEAVLCWTRRLGQGDPAADFLVAIAEQEFFDPKTPSTTKNRSLSAEREKLNAVIDSLGMCAFTALTLSADDYRDLYNAATGSDLSTEDLLAAGKEILASNPLF